MVEKYTDFEIQCKEPDGTQYVLATDYAALEAERDEWKRRCEAMWRTIQLGAPLDREITVLMGDIDQERWYEHNQMNTDFAEVRDNG